MSVDCDRSPPEKRTFIFSSIQAFLSMNVCNSMTWRLSNASLSGEVGCVKVVGLGLATGSFPSFARTVPDGSLDGMTREDGTDSIEGR